MFINCTRQAVNTWQLYCNSCGNAMDIVDSMELSGLMVYGQGALCMDCDPALADSITPVLWQDETPYLLIFEQKEIVVCDWPNALESFRERVEFYRQELHKLLDEEGRLMGDFCLSSFSNLKTVSDNEQ